MSSSETPPRRADAERNRDKIVAAARVAFADAGADISMAEISRRAGVGMATLYRNFPGRRELLEALYSDEVDAVVRATDGASEATPAAALTAWLRRFFAYATSKRHVTIALLEHSDGHNPVFSNNRARVLDAARPLLTAAQADRSVRDDLSLEQILDLIVAVATIPADADYLEPLLQIALKGLQNNRPEAAG